MSFNDFIHKCKLKNEATPNNKIQSILSSLASNDVRIYLRDGPFKTDLKIINLHPFQGTHWVLYIHKCYFDSFGWSPPQKLFKPIIKRNGHWLFSEYKIHGLTSTKDSHCAGYCLYIDYLTKLIGIDFKSVVSNLYYQRFILHK